MAGTQRACPLRRQRGLTGTGLRRALGTPRGEQFETTRTAAEHPLRAHGRPLVLLDRRGHSKKLRDIRWQGSRGE